MKRHTKIVIASVLVLGLVGGVAAKSFGSCSPEKRADRVVKRVSNKLELNESQQAQLAQLKTRLMQGFGDMRAQHPQVDDIQNLLKSQFDQAQALQMVTQRSDALAKNAPELITAFAQFYDVLNTTQQAKLSDMVERRMTHHKHGRRHD